MVGIFTLVNTNTVTKFNLARLANSSFCTWARVSIEYSKVRYALVADIVLNHNMLHDCYCTVVNTSTVHVSNLTFQLGQKAVVVTEHVLNRIFRFPENNHVPDPTDLELFTLFQQLTYVIEGEFTQAVLKDMYEHILQKEWNFYFLTLNHYFAPKKGGHADIASFRQKLGYAVAHNLSINFGKLILDQIIMVMGPRG